MLGKSKRTRFQVFPCDLMSEKTLLLRFVSVLFALVPTFALAGDTSETNY